MWKLERVWYVDRLMGKLMFAKLYKGWCCNHIGLLLVFQASHLSAGSGLNIEVVHAITAELRKRLGLMLFGYDTVVQENTGVLTSSPLLCMVISDCKLVYILTCAHV